MTRATSIPIPGERPAQAKRSDWPSLPRDPLFAAGRLPGQRLGRRDRHLGTAVLSRRRSLVRIGGDAGWSSRRGRSTRGSPLTRRGSPAGRDALTCRGSPPGRDPLACRGRSPGRDRLTASARVWLVTDVGLAGSELLRSGGARGDQRSEDDDGQPKAGPAQGCGPGGVKRHDRIFPNPRSARTADARPHKS